jgi:hypothetical protein
MTPISKRVTEILGRTAIGPIVDEGSAERELRAAIEEFRAECMAKCLAVLTAVSHIDRQRDFDRGESAAASHILRGIQEIKVQ